MLLRDLDTSSDGGTGVVELIPHRGALIRALTRSDAEDLLQVLEVLCGLAARLAAVRIGMGDNRNSNVSERG